MKRILPFFLVLALFISPILLVGETEPMLPDNFFTGDLTAPELVIEPGSNLTIDEATRLAAAQNLDIQIARIDLRKRNRDVSISKSIYDTNLNIDANYSQDHQQRVSTVLGNREIEGSVETAFQKKIPTGTTLGVKGSSRRDSTTTVFTTLDRSYNGLLEFSVKQPLLKNFFGMIDRSEIKKVKLDVQKFAYENLDNIEQSITDIRGKYWDLVFAYENLRNRRDDLKKAQEFLKITRDKMGIGLTEKPDRYAAESNVRKRVIQVWRAMTDLHAASYALKVLLNTEEVSLIIPKDRPEFKPYRLNFDIEYENALRNRRDLKALQLEMKRQGIEVKIKSNERLPDLDFDGRVGSTGLDRKHSAAQGKVYGFDRRQYFAGIQFSIPLENREARGKHYQEKMQLSRIEKEHERLKMEIGREVDNQIRNLKLVEERVKQTQEIRRLENKKLEEEEKNFNLGRSDSKTIIDFQEDVILAETEAIRALVDYAKTLDQYYRTSNRLIEWVGLTEEGITIQPESKLRV